LIKVWVLIVWLTGGPMVLAEYDTKEHCSWAGQEIEAGRHGMTWYCFPVLAKGRVR
tara:strand:+ start:1956 stop:2123 length:168 start_codon:yes stop_codon:yes gene_type:complete